MPTTYAPCPDLRSVAESLMDHHPHLRGRPIAYVERRGTAGRETVAARVMTPLMRHVAGVDAIVVADCGWASDGATARRAAVDHALCTIGWDGECLYARRPDVAEFSEVIDRHGLWTAPLADAAAVMARQARQLSLFEAEDGGEDNGEDEDDGEDEGVSGDADGPDGDAVSAAVDALRGLSGYQAADDDGAWLADVLSRYPVADAGAEVLACGAYWAERDARAEERRGGFGEPVRPRWRSRVSAWLRSQWRSDHALGEAMAL